MIIAVVMVALIAAGGAVALDSGTERAAAEQTITNESFTSDAGTVTLAESNREVFYQSGPSVYAVPNGATNVTAFDQSGNYSFDTTTGTLDVEANSPLANASDASVTYSFGDPSEAQAVTNDAAGLVLGPMSQGIIIVVGLALMLSALRMFS
jgi:type II secretory pathway pseudopilin PulG